MTDQQLDELIDRAKPDLRKALRMILESQTGGHLFNIASQRLPSGARWDVVVAVLNEPTGRLVEAVLEGTDRMTQSFVKAMGQPPPSPEV